MLIVPLRTPVLKKGDDLASILSTETAFEKGDILVVSSKAIATTEGAQYILSALTPSEDAKTYAGKIHRDPHFVEAILLETKRLRGSVRGTCPGALLTEVRPEGLPHGTIFAPNAGLDESNTEKGTAIGWPKDAVFSASSLSKTLGIPVIITDSCCIPRRSGVTAFALTCCGVDPLRSEIGKKDLFGKPLTITTEAIADQLAVAANFVMGNASQSIPAAIIRDHELPSSDFCGWVPGMEPEEDLFRELLKD